MAEEVMADTGKGLPVFLRVREAEYGKGKDSIFL